MKIYLKEFLHRGLIFAGFGPIILGVLYTILSASINGFSLSGEEVFLGIISTYMLGFIHAGSSVFHMVESWSIPKAALLQLATLYVSYTVCYLINSWIPLKASIIIIYTAIFVAAYLIIWLSILIATKCTCKKMNEKFKNM